VNFSLTISANDYLDTSSTIRGLLEDWSVSGDRKSGACRSIAEIPDFARLFRDGDKPILAFHENPRGKDCRLTVLLPPAYPMASRSDAFRGHGLIGYVDSEGQERGALLRFRLGIASFLHGEEIGAPRTRLVPLVAGDRVVRNVHATREVCLLIGQPHLPLRGNRHKM
jgi:hypothetical protein